VHTKPKEDFGPFNELMPTPAHELRS